MNYQSYLNSPEKYLLVLYFSLFFASYVSWSFLLGNRRIITFFFLSCRRGNLVCLKLSPNLRRVHKDTKTADERTAKEIELSKMERLIATNKGWLVVHFMSTRIFNLVVRLGRNIFHALWFSSFDNYYFEDKITLAKAQWLKFRRQINFCKVKRAFVFL